ncbi:MAG TPA: amidase [Thermoanaerobaculia bacterium]|jgi:amidase|nr:amidase [Thermoanaerobaculia bacterium]
MSEDHRATGEDERNVRDEVSRRTFLRLGAIAGAGAPLAGLLGSPAARAATAAAAEDVEIEAAHGSFTVVETSIADLQAAMTRGRVTSLDLVNQYLDRIAKLDQGGPRVNSVLELNPDARQIARSLDAERKAHHVRGPLHGIPVMLKGNIDTGDKMSTTAGSLALLGPPAPQDATVAARLRAAGAVILGKTNLSEWANFRGNNSTSGWSGQGGQTGNPYVLDRNPCGSSSGSGASATASFVAAGLGTETDGSIVCPASLNGVVGIKPTVGLTSRAGVIPISHTQDTVGPHARTVADAAAILSALVGVDPRDPATAASAGKFSTDYTQFLDPNGLQGARIGVWRHTTTGYSRETDAIFESALKAMSDAGAILVDPADIPTVDALNATSDEITVLIYEFKRDLNAYLATRTGLQVHTLADIIAFNNAHASQELQYFGQELFELAEADPFSAQDYAAALADGKRLAATEGIDAILAAKSLDALVAPTGSPAWTTDLVNGDHFTGASSGPSAVAGYPIVNVLGGYSFGVLPVGISFFGTAFSEGKLIKLAYSFEQHTRLRKPPAFLRTLPTPGHASTKSLATTRVEDLLDRLSSPAAARPLPRYL